MNQKYTTKAISLLAILTAVTFVLGRFVEIPIPAVNGYVTLLDAGIFTVALSFGKKEGAIVGGLAAFLTDLTSGYPQWMFFSLVIHGLQGYFGAFSKSKIINAVISSAIMVIGYFLASAFLYGFATAINPLTNIPNLIQTLVGYLAGLMISQLLQRAGVLNGLK